MLNLDVQLEPSTEQKLKRVLEQHSDKETFFQYIIQYQIDELKNGIINIAIDLKKFEEKYQKSSQDFYQQYQEGLLGDEEDDMIWSGIYEMQLENKRKLAELE